ncbi:hypothetical protein HZA99_06785 [Candidatus Woesearchaeota archaeon]|nr:hypothetical protein [Candidatus Woesearchaeota archaeon]
MKDLRGQISVFVIIGLLVLLSIGLIMFSLQQGKISQTSGGVEEESVRAYVQGCLDETTKEALFTIGLRGGYNIVPEPKTDALMILSIPYFLYDQKTYIPSLDEIANQMEQYLSMPLDSCLVGLSNISCVRGSYAI